MLLGAPVAQQDGSCQLQAHREHLGRDAEAGVLLREDLFGPARESAAAGATSRIDLAQARTQRLLAEDAALDARTEAARSAVALCRALGGGWKG